MKINIFAGARRIALAIGVLGVVITIFASIYNYQNPSQQAKEAQEKLLHLHLAKYRVELPDGSKYEIEIPEQAPTQGKLSYEEWIAAGERAKQMSFEEYTEARATIDNELSRNITYWTTKSMYTLIGLAIWWAIVAAIGWIVRGFMGISKGQDFRQTDNIG